MRDGPIRRFLKLLARGVFAVDLAATRAIRRATGEKPYRLGGSCACCAKCCEAPTIQTNPVIFRSRVLGGLFLAWHRRVNGFELTGRIPSLRAFVFRCTHFDPETRRCDSYSSRPGMCRDYPRLLLWEANPPFLPGCGYRAISPNAERVAQLLEGEGLDPQKLAELKRRLHVDESGEDP